MVINKTDEDNIAGVNTGLWSATIYLLNSQHYTRHYNCKTLFLLLYKIIVSTLGSLMLGWFKLMVFIEIMIMIRNGSVGYIDGVAAARLFSNKT